MSRACHKYSRLPRTTIDLHGCLSAVRLTRQTVRDSYGHRESTSQAEYSGSIPVIGSMLTSANGVERRFGF